MSDAYVGEGVEVEGSVKASGFLFSSASLLVRDRLVEEGRDKLLPIASDNAQHDDAVLKGGITRFYQRYIHASYFVNFRRKRRGRSLKEVSLFMSSVMRVLKRVPHEAECLDAYVLLRCERVVISI